jgi:hypothetical protein
MVSTQRVFGRILDVVEDTIFLWNDIGISIQFFLFLTNIILFYRIREIE